MPKITCIIPAYNEANRITSVIQTALMNDLLHEVIIVDDGSTDGTAEVVIGLMAGSGKASLIRHDRNRGKCAAICTGIRAAKSEFVLLLDSDLSGLTAGAINDLVRPIINGEADVSISLRRNCPKTWRRIGLDYISGERVFRRNLLIDHLEKIESLPGFGLEVFINSIIIKRNCRIMVVPWPDVDSPYKYKKYGWYKGMKLDLKMIMDIIRTVGPLQPAIQIRKMLKLRVGGLRADLGHSRVSVVIPAHNEESALADTIQAALAQDYPDFEVIVVDNASTDRTSEIASQFPVKVVSETRKGLLWAREAGRTAASGEIIANIDADCLPEKNWLSRGVAHFNDKRISAVTGPYDYHDATGAFRGSSLFTQKYVYGAVNSIFQLPMVRCGAVLIGGNNLIRSEILEKAGGYNTNLVFYGEDTDTAKRAATYGKVVFDRSLEMKTSARRFKSEGTLHLMAKYWFHFFKTIFVS